MNLIDLFPELSEDTPIEEAIRSVIPRPTHLHYDDFIRDRAKAKLENSDAEHFDALHKTGFFGKAGAGCIFLAKDTNRILIAHRSMAVEQPGVLGTFGGAINSGETPEQAVRREVKEESGYIDHFELIPLYVFAKDSFRYYNYLAIVPEEFKPVLDWETQGYRWCDFGNWPSPLHFGLQQLFSDQTSMKIIRNVIDK